ncbi:MAG: deiodinase-like protein [Saprospiraceae bacterium]|nr:redoxin domain-containing protein [Lewinella sp.]
MKSLLLSSTLIFLLLSANLLHAQNKVKPLKSTPDDSKQIEFKKSAAMEDHNYMMRWDVLVKQTGEKAPDFTIRHLNGKTFTLHEELKKGKPILLINGSYTCDISRDHIPEVAQLAHKYKKKISVYVVHTVEAHPSDMPSPYSISNEVWLSKLNVKAGIEAERPKTYLERRQLTSKWIVFLRIKPKVLVDNPDNTFWNTYGQAPNMAFLISPDEIISASQVFFEKEQMKKNIDRLLD